MKPNLSKFNINKKSLINHSKNERGAGRKCINGTKSEKSISVHLTKEQDGKLKQYIKANNLKSQSSFVRSLLIEKDII